ncbi:MAG: DNA methyltransferase [Nitrosopumilus sp.]
MNYLFLGDCYDVLRHDIQNESVDLIYIDPPFNSKRDYNIFFDDGNIKEQRVAFEDTWTLKNIQSSLEELNNLQTEKLYHLLMTYSEIAPHAFPYLTMMGLRIIELHRVLKETGSFYLHCDPTMSHYLKTICDVVFNYKNFKNEIIWHYRRWTGSSKRFMRMHDILLFYGKKSKLTKFNTQFTPYTEGSLKRKQHYHTRIKGDDVYETKIDKRGVKENDVWYIQLLNSQSKERLGYPTQKPKKLLERIIKSSSNEGDIVLDAFCGCGTTIDVCEGLNRKWIGIDVSPIAISLIKRRLEKTYGTDVSKYEVRGIPTTEQSSIKLWEQNPFAFQDWWVMEYEVMSLTEGTKGPDKGLDGIGKYDIGNEKTIKVGFQVKGGKNVQSKDIDALMGSMKKFDCEMGVFLSTAKPTKPMLETITNEGFIELEITGQKFPRLQIQTLHQFFSNERVKLPSQNITFRSASFKSKSQQLSIKT